MTLLLQKSSRLFTWLTSYTKTSQKVKSVRLSEHKTVKADALTTQRGRPRSALVHPAPQAPCPDGIGSLRGAPHSCWSVHKAESFALENRNKTASFSYSTDQTKGRTTRLIPQSKKYLKMISYLFRFTWGPRRARKVKCPCPRPQILTSHFPLAFGSFSFSSIPFSGPSRKCTRYYHDHSRLPLCIQNVTKYDVILLVSQHHSSLPCLNSYHHFSSKLHYKSSNRPAYSTLSSNPHSTLLPVCSF